MPGEEQLPQSENLVIPQKWRFLERSDPDLRPLIVDEANGFLACELPDRELTTRYSSYVAYADYFFDTNGGIIESRRYTNAVGGYYIWVDSYGETVKSITINEELPIEKAPRLGINESPIESPYPVLLIVSSRILRKSKDLGFTRDNSGAFVYRSVGDKEVLRKIDLGDIFMRDENDEIVDFPRGYSLLRSESASGEILADWQFNFRDWDPSYTYELKDENNVLIKKEGEDFYKVNWEFDDGGGIAVTETHLPSGIQKVLRSSLEVEMSPILVMATAKPPYQKRQFGKIEVLDIPWKRLDRFIGANIGHQYPNEHLKEQSEVVDDLEEL